MSGQGRGGGYRRPESLISVEGETVPEVEYLLDGSDYDFLESLNARLAGGAVVSPGKIVGGGGSGGGGAGAGGSAKKKKKKEEPVINMERFEVIMTKLERAIWDAQEEAHSHERMAAEGEDLELPFKSSDTPCGVCFQRRKSRKNNIVECDMCHNSAHMSCAVFNIVEKRKRWRCQGCVDGMGYGKLLVPLPVSRKPLACSMCPFGLEAGVMMRTLDKKQWVHPRCAIWLGAALLGRRTVLKAVKLAAPNDHQDGQCFICKRKNSGALVKCDHDGCGLQFHVSCAPRKSCWLNVDNIYFVNRNMTAAASLATGNQASLTGASPTTPGSGMGGNGSHDDGMGMLSSSKRGKGVALKAYKKYNEISVNVSQFCPAHSPKTQQATLDAESIWVKVAEMIPALLPPGCDAEAAKEIYNHWVDRRRENGKWGELPLLRSLEARRSAQRQEKKRRKKEQKRLTVPSGGLLHIPTDPVYNQMIQLRVEMDKARTIIDLLARRERFKKQIMQHDADELGLEEWLGEPEQPMDVDVAELSTDNDADGTPAGPRPPPPRPPSMVVALPHGLPPVRSDLPQQRNRRRGPPRTVPASQAGSLLLVWPEESTFHFQHQQQDVQELQQHQSDKKRPLGLVGEADLPLADFPELDVQIEEKSDDDEEWAKTYKKKGKSKKKKAKLEVKK